MRATPATVGRETELEAIRAFIDAVPRGPTALSISGQAGIGKTVLWEAGVDLARQRFGRVLVSRGIEAEASLSFAALSELITPVFDEVVAELTTPRRRALEVALLLVDSDGAAPDPLAIGLAVFDSLRVLAAKGPCILAIDDAQWIDSSSAIVLQTALKRLDDQPVGVLVTIRGSPGVALPIELDRCFGDSELRSVTVGPISSAALHRLLRDRLSIELGGNDVARLHTMTDGNPFFALEVGREMLRTNTRSTDPTALRVPDSLRELVGGRLARLPIETGDVLLEMAALARPTIGVLAAAHGDRERVVRALDSAASEGLVRLDDSHLRFSHPLHASICYQQAPIWKRQAVHRALADAVNDPEERALHLAHAADGPDAAVAAGLDEAAESAAARGAPAAGAELYRLAASLTPSSDTADSRRRRIRTSALDRLSGSMDRAVATLEELRAELPAGVERARVLYELSLTRQFEVPKWVALCDEALLEAAGDDALSAQILLSRTQAHMLRGHVSATLEDAWTALELAERAGASEVVAQAIARISHGETYGARATPGLVERGVAIERSLPLGLEYLSSPRAGLARRLMRMGELDESRLLLEEVARDARARGEELQHAQAFWSLGKVEWYAGRWDVALAHATVATDEGHQMGEGHLLCIAGRIRGLIEADLGLIDQARATAGAGATAAHGMSDDYAEISALAILGRIELMLGNLEAAADILRDLLPWFLALGVVDPTEAAWPDTIETFLTIGQVDVIRDLFEQWEAQARALASPLSLATTARCRGLLAASTGDFVTADAAFQESLDELTGSLYPLERARTLLCRGVALRQAQQRVAARGALEGAIAIFDELGARLWAEKARAELGRVSGRRPAAQILTDAEREVATLAAQGQSNKEIAASLHMGVSTVESHLSSVYRKLDVRRAALGAALEAQ